MNKFFFTIFLSLFLINISDSKEITYGEAAFSIIQYSNLFNEDISKNITFNKNMAGNNMAGLIWRFLEKSAIFIPAVIKAAVINTAIIIPCKVH